MAEVLWLLDAPGVDPVLREHVRAAVQVVREAMHVYSRPGELVFSFNGGKDSTVVLHAIRAAVLQRRREAAVAGGRPAESADADASWDAGVSVVYFESHHNFTEVLAFMDAEAARYGFTIRRLPGFKAGLEALVAEGVRGVLMGTRSTDPDGAGLQHFRPTTLNWPPVMRICPALEWGYAAVWDVLRYTGGRYCHLYDWGYTSLGSTRDSTPNPRLRRPLPPHPSPTAEPADRFVAGAAADAPPPHRPADPLQPPATPGGDQPARLGLYVGATSGNRRYYPAWMLLDGAAERLGRASRGGTAAPGDSDVAVAAQPTASVIVVAPHAALAHAGADGALAAATALVPEISRALASELGLAVAEAALPPLGRTLTTGPTLTDDGGLAAAVNAVRTRRNLVLLLVAGGAQDSVGVQVTATALGRVFHDRRRLCHEGGTADASSKGACSSCATADGACSCDPPLVTTASNVHVLFAPGSGEHLRAAWDEWRRRFVPPGGGLPLPLLLGGGGAD
jgi:3'-phosphoadenosine 5'-phosphosulfate sulfotransferase (PAPS reductase)/FAD synthetase